MRPTPTLLLAAAALLAGCAPGSYADGYGAGYAPAAYGIGDTAVATVPAYPGYDAPVGPAYGGPSDPGYPGGIVLVERDYGWPRGGYPAYGWPGGRRDDWRREDWRREQWRPDERRGSFGGLEARREEEFGRRRAIEQQREALQRADAGRRREEAARPGNVQVGRPSGPDAPLNPDQRARVLGALRSFGR